MGRLLLVLQYLWSWLRQPKDRNKSGLPDTCKAKPVYADQPCRHASGRECRCPTGRDFCPGPQ